MAEPLTIVTLTAVSEKMTYTKSVHMTASELEALPALLAQSGLSQRGTDEFYSDEHDISLQIADHGDEISTAQGAVTNILEMLKDPGDSDWTQY